MPRGFTLVELSIVLVIIGLLIGGILVAQSMVSTAKIQAQVKQIEEYDIIVSNFRTTYRSWPGDSNIFSPYGNGNGRITPNDSGNDQFNGEMRNFWVHLYRAGMVDSPYTAALPSPAAMIPANTAFPAAVFYPKYTGIVAIHPPVGDATRVFQDAPANLWIIARHSGTNIDTTTYDGIPTAAAAAIDNKIDDGLHYSGDVRAARPSDLITVLPAASNNCTTAATSGYYKLSNTNELACSLAVKILSTSGGP